MVSRGRKRRYQKKAAEKMNLRKMSFEQIYAIILGMSLAAALPNKSDNSTINQFRLVTQKALYTGDNFP